MVHKIKVALVLFTLSGLFGALFVLFSWNFYLTYKVLDLGSDLKTSNTLIGAILEANAAGILDSSKSDWAEHMEQTDREIIAQVNRLTESAGSLNFSRMRYLNDTSQAKP